MLTLDDIRSHDDIVLAEKRHGDEEGTRTFLITRVWHGLNSKNYLVRTGLSEKYAATLAYAVDVFNAETV